jgi:hypothetical protein
MRSTIASAAARPAATLSSPGWPNTTRVIAVRLPSIQRMARKAKQPPAALVRAGLDTDKPVVAEQCVGVVDGAGDATGNVALGVATMLANTDRRMARSTTRIWSAAVDTVASS